MKTLAKTTLTAVAAVLVASAAFAGPNDGALAQHRDAVIDKNNQVVKNTFGNCVLTKWENAGGADCANGAAEAVMEEFAIYFDFDSSKLTAASKAKLDALVDVIKNSEQVQNVEIVGYADAFGDNGYNTALSQRRANTVKKYLSAKGYGKTVTGTKAMGEETTVSSCDGVTGNELKACLWRDRRVQLNLTPAN